MVLLFDIGNTHTHVGLADAVRVRKAVDLLTADCFKGQLDRPLRKFIAGTPIEGASLCSVVPQATPQVRAWLDKLKLECLELSPKTLSGVGINYPKPRTIGPDRLANAVAARTHFGSPAVVVDFGTAVTFDVVDAKGDYVGGIIAPGLAAMTEYLHEKTALLPRIKIRDTEVIIGKNTKEAMLIGAVHGYRGLIRELLKELRRALASRKLPVIATGGYAELIAARLPEITAVEPCLTLEGLRLVWQARKGRVPTAF